MVGADGHPLAELIEDVVLWPFRLARCGVTAFTIRMRRNSTPSVWMPRTEVERTVYAALILAGEPVNNLKLAALMGVSPSEASRRVSQLEGFVSKTRVGRQVLIELA